MSAWPQAVWIVRKLQKKINFPNLVDSVTRDLNNLGKDVNDLYISLQQTIENLENSVITISDTKTNNNTPTNYSTTNFSTGAIWLIEENS